ncbi:hypothetical protein K7X08_029861 [Anisodus acutangulus]|uniref:Uncharacterized protein n=1 Tax=Anisodus acutangulus TaxID=402998 RepID=A0A9Q1R9D0_9SOLA|nr:hypothetical protein K7X08_029861 [Anisodus acutangulus]
MTALLKGSCIHRDKLVGCNANFKKLTCETYVLFGSEEVREIGNTRAWVSLNFPVAIRLNFWHGSFI